MDALYAVFLGVGISFSLMILTPVVYYYISKWYTYWVNK